MSCEYRRRKFLGLLVSGGGVGNVEASALSAQVASLERVYQQAYDAARARREQAGQPVSSPLIEQENRRKTRLLFGHMLRMGVPLPVHSASGLPKAEAQAGYAALWDALKARIVPSTSAFQQPAPPSSSQSSSGQLVASVQLLAEAGASGTAGASDPTRGWTGPWLAPGDGPLHDQEGYDTEGYDRQGFDRTGRDRNGFDRSGYNADGFDRSGQDAGGRDRQGYDKEGYDKEGYNRRGFDKEGKDRWSYDWMGFDNSGFDRTGYDKHGYNRTGFDKHGYDRQGYNKRGYDRRGYNRQGIDANSVDRFGYDAQGMRAGFDKQGYDPAGIDSDGYDRDGYDVEGYDRNGYDRTGHDRSGHVHSWWTPDDSGYYGDGFDQYGFDREGYDDEGPEGRDRWGFNRQGLNERDRDRDGYNREGYDSAFLDREKYNQAGYDAQGYDRLGYNMHGLGAPGTDPSSFSITGYDKDGYDRKGMDRWGRDRNNRDNKTGRQYRTLPYNKSGFDREGYDRWGFHRETGLTADGRNYAGWVYNSKTKRCHDKADPSRSMPHNHYQDGHGVQWQRPRWQTRVEWDPSAAPKWDPRAPMSWDDYARVNGATGSMSSMGATGIRGAGSQGTHEAVRRSYEARLNPQPNIEQRWQSVRGGRSGMAARANFDPQASLGGVPARCPQCGQFTGYRTHECPAFGNRPVTVYRSGLARREGQPDYLRAGDDYSDKGLHADTRQTMDGCYLTPNAYGPLANGYSDANPRRAEGAEGVEERDPAYSNGGYNRFGYDQDDTDRLGRDRRGRDEDGYDRAGYDWLGRDRDGFDRHGHDHNGHNRAGVKRPRSLHDLAGDYETPGMEGDILSNEGVRRLYSQVASSLAGKSRQVVFREGGGFATDMQGTIYLDPYPLGREAPPVYNAAVVMEGLQHELGHELETPLDTFKRILDIAESPQPVEGLDGGRRLVKTIYNIVEDGRMERRISQLPGVAEYLAVGCKLQPRWDEQVGEKVPVSHEVQGALLYEALPFYQVRPDVLDAMTPKSRALFEELRPIVHQGVFGEPEEAYRASIEIARRLQAEGVSAPDEQIHVSVPAFFFSAGRSDGDGSDQSGSAGAGHGHAPSQSTGSPGAPVGNSSSIPAGGAETGAGAGTGRGDRMGAGVESAGTEAGQASSAGGGEPAAQQNAPGHAEGSRSPLAAARDEQTQTADPAQNPQSAQAPLAPSASNKGVQPASGHEESGNDEPQIPGASNEHADNASPEAASRATEHAARASDQATLQDPQDYRHSVQRSPDPACAR